MATLPLEGVLVIDLTRVLSGPYCTMNLLNLGARVIKVEKPPIGDDSRMYPPFSDKCPVPFHSINHGKESIALDIKNNHEDRVAFEKLLAQADVLVENFTPGFMDSIGYSWNEVKAINPAIVYASISGFGHSGEKSKFACYDLVAQGMSGLMSITGHPDDKPLKVGTEIADLISGMFAAIGINAALYKTKVTKQGSHIDVSMLDSLVSLLQTTVSPTTATQVTPHATGNRHSLLAPFDVYFTQDAPISICIGNDKLFRQLCQLMGKPEAADDERFHTNVARVKNVEALTTAINQLLSKQPAEHWLQLFRQNGIPSGPINTIEDMLHEPQLHQRNMLQSFAEQFMIGVKVPGNPIKFTDTIEPAELKRGPKLGEHTKAVFKEFNLGNDKTKN